MNPDYIHVATCDFCEREAAKDSDYCDHHTWLWFGRDDYGNEIRETVVFCGYGVELADLGSMRIAELIIGDLASIPGAEEVAMDGVTVLHPLGWPTFSFPSPLPSYYPTTER